jgi:glutathione S-transferase
LSWTASEYHASIGPLFNPTVVGDVKEFVSKKLHTKIAYLEKEVAGKKFLVGDSFTIADAYQYIALSWLPYVGIDLAAYPNVKAYFEGIKGLEGVQAGHARIATEPKTTI